MSRRSNALKGATGGLQVRRTHGPLSRVSLSGWDRSTSPTGSDARSTSVASRVIRPTTRSRGRNSSAAPRKARSGAEKTIWGGSRHRGDGARANLDAFQPADRPAHAARRLTGHAHDLARHATAGTYAARADQECRRSYTRTASSRKRPRRRQRGLPIVASTAAARSMEESSRGSRRCPALDFRSSAQPKDDEITAEPRASRGGGIPGDRADARFHVLGWRQPTLRVAYLPSSRDRDRFTVRDRPDASCMALERTPAGGHAGRGRALGPARQQDRDLGRPRVPALAGVAADPLKGIHRPDDARRGAQALPWTGDRLEPRRRQVDGSIAALRRASGGAAPSGTMPVLFDGGIRSSRHRKGARRGCERGS